MEPGAVMIAPALSLQRLSVEMALDATIFPLLEPGWRRTTAGSSRGSSSAGLKVPSSGRSTSTRREMRRWPAHHAEQALAQANDPRQPLVLLAVHRFLGELDVEAKQFEAAEEHLQQSLKLADACAAPFERALTLLEIAKLRAAQGASEKVRELLAEVRSICEPLGAKPTLEHVAALEQQLGEQLEALNA